MWYNGSMIYNRLIKHKKSACGIAIGFLIFTILVYAFQSHWLVRHIYKYIDYWAIPLSAAFMLVLAYMAYISIAENRRREALNRMRTWAKDAIRMLSAPIQEELPILKRAKWKERIQAIRAESLITLADARVIGGDLEKKVKNAVSSLNSFTDLSERDNVPSADFRVSLTKLLTDLTEVINSASKI